MHQAISTNFIPVLMFKDVDICGQGIIFPIVPLKGGWNNGTNGIPMEHQRKKSGPPQVRCCDWRRKPRGGAWHRPHLHPAKRPRDPGRTLGGIPYPHIHRFIMIYHHLPHDLVATEWDIPHVRSQPYMRQHYCVWSWWAIGPVYLLPWSQYALPNASVISLKVPVGEDMANDVMPWCLLLCICMCFIHSSGCRGKLRLHCWTERIMAPSNWPLCWSATTMSKHICSWTAPSKWLTNHENPLVPRKGYLPNNRNRRCQNKTNRSIVSTCINMF